ncbi:hypothetical protein JB92DRAFT_1594159 [Gautieria morchelliformis]|nr:hypothetical protein JB92DRAFT_1594159 [Gautieria morchelliformis]
MSSIEPLANGGGNATRYELNSPASERAVDVPFPTAEDTTETTPVTAASEHAVDVPLPTAEDTTEATPVTVPLLSSSSNGIHHSELNDDKPQTYMLNASSSLDDSHCIPRPDALNDMRGALMDSFQKAVYLRYPNLDVDHDKLKERFVKKLTDAEVQDFIRMGKGVVDDLRRAGRIGEVKRKLASHGRDDENEARRNRRRIYRSLSPLPADDGQSTDRMEVDLSTPGGSPRASTSKAILAGQHEGLTITSSGPRIGSSSTPIDRRTQQDTSNPHPLANDSHMSTSTLPQQPLESPHSGPYSNPSDSGPHKDVSMSPSNILESASTADEHRRSHEMKHEGIMAIDDEPSDFWAPRILLAKQGHSTADVVDASFDVNEQLFNATRRWTQRWKDYDTGQPHMRLYLTSISTTAAENVLRELPPNPPSSRLAELVSQISIVWPPPGTFYLSLNEERTETMFWGEHFFGPSSPPLDISNFLVSGENTIRFIQLKDHSQLLFLILAMPPSETEKQKRAVWNNQLGEHPVSGTGTVQAISGLGSESA